MATPTSRRAPAPDTLIEERDALCAELIALERDGQPRVGEANGRSSRGIAGQLHHRRVELLQFSLEISQGPYGSENTFAFRTPHATARTAGRTSTTC
jgi:hypothetical protein